MPKRGLSLAFGQLIRKRRHAQNLSQEGLAERANVHPTYIGLLERGLRAPGLDVSGRIAHALGIKLSELIAEAERQMKGK